MTSKVKSTLIGIAAGVMGLLIMPVLQGRMPMIMVLIVLAVIGAIIGLAIDKFIK